MKHIRRYLVLIIVIQQACFSMYQPYQPVTTEIVEKKYDFIDKLNGYSNKEIQMNIKNSRIYKQICITTQKGQAEICCFLYNYGILKRLRTIFKDYSIEYSTANIGLLNYFSIYTSLEIKSCKSILDLLFTQESEITEESREGFITKTAHFITEQKINYAANILEVKNTSNS